MADVEFVPFISWAIISAAVFAIVTLVYRSYLRKKAKSF
jgi:hypothetical protein